ncbi:MAG TPA: RDD family protein [Verrucomicrobiae bacterium]|nr:RDD family protein [Verrucomicrobiae bacterium]
MIGLVAGTEILPRPAPLDARFSAFLLDGLIFFVPAFATQMWSLAAPFDVALRIQAFWMLAYLVYFAAFWSFGHGQTPGMRVRRLRLVDGNGRDLGFGRALARAAVLLFGMALGIVPLSVMLDRDGTAIHDRLFGTRVIRMTT